MRAQTLENEAKRFLEVIEKLVMSHWTLPV